MSFTTRVVEANGKLFVNAAAALAYLEEKIANTTDEAELERLRAEFESVISVCPKSPRQGSCPRPSDYPVSVLVEVALFDNNEEAATAKLPFDFEATIDYMLSSTVYPIEKQAFDYRFKEGLTYEEIATRLGRSVNSVRTYLNTCYRILRNHRKLVKNGVSATITRMRSQLSDADKEIKLLKDKTAYLSEQLGRYDTDAVMTPIEQEEVFWEAMATANASTRLLNALRRAQITTRKKLLGYDKPFSRIRNCGIATFNELQGVCKSLGWNFKGRWT